MFKKFKDKLAEEMKQSPARLQAGMQQLAQAVSPSVSTTSIQDLSSSRDNFSLNDINDDDVSANSPLKHGFQSVDLNSPSVNSVRSRKSSVSSTTSDISSLFPIYESPQTHYHWQSDMDQSASEMDDSVGTQLDRVTKEQLYAQYRKMQTKYIKYRGRFKDLASHYQEIEKTNVKLETILVETQDKALRRIGDLKEQCQLEQQAKAHLEDALRNDLEEKDHIISALKTKIKLIQQKGTSLPKTEDDVDNNQSDDVLVDISNVETTEESETESNLPAEHKQLREKFQNLEILSEKYKDMLKRNKDKISEITSEKNTLERDNENLKSRCELLQGELDVFKKREEDAVISLAENKLSIHRELDEKEEQIKKIRLEAEKVRSNMLKQLHGEVKKNLHNFEEKILNQNSHALEKLKTHEKSVARICARLKKYKNLESENEELRRTLEEKNEICEKSNLKIEEHKIAFDKFKKKMLAQSKEIQSLKNKPLDTNFLLDELTNLREECSRLKLKMSEAVEEGKNAVSEFIVDKVCLKKEVEERLIDLLSEKEKEIQALNNLLLKEREHVNEQMRENEHLSELLEEEKENSNELNDFWDREKENVRERERENEHLNNLLDKEKEYSSEREKENQQLSNLLDKERDRYNEIAKKNEHLANLLGREKETSNELNDLLDRERENVDEKEKEIRDLSDLLDREKEICKEHVKKNEQLHDLLERERESSKELNDLLDKERENISAKEKENQQLSKLLEQERERSEQTQETEYLNSLLEKEREYVTKKEKENEHLNNSLDLERKRCGEQVRENEHLTGLLNKERENARQLNNLLDLTKKENEQMANMLDEERQRVTVREEENQRLNNLIDQATMENKQLTHLLDREKENSIELNNLLIKEKENIYEKEKELNNSLENLNLKCKAYETNLDECKNIIKTKDKGLGELVKNFTSLRILNEKQLGAAKTKMLDIVAEFGNEFERLKSALSAIRNENDAFRRGMIRNEEKSLMLGEIDSCREKISHLTHNLKIKEEEIKNFRTQIGSLEENLALKVNELKALDITSRSEKGNLKSNLEERDSEVKDLNLKNSALSEKVEQLLTSNINLNQTLEQLEKKLAEKESKNLQLEGDLKSKIEMVNLEKTKLESQLDEALVTFQTKETQMQSIKEDLNSKIESLQHQLKLKDEEQNVRIKQIGKEFQAQLHDKDVELQAALEKRFDRQQNYETDVILEYKEQLRDFQVELTRKSQELENLMTENKKLTAQVNDLRLELERNEKDFNQRLKDTIKQKTDKLETMHQQEVIELTTEWQGERKNSQSSQLSNEDLENTAKVAVATVQSNAGSFHTLQQTLLSQKKELAELRKLVNLRHDSLDESTEIEYLRNILYKYMMGKETMILAKVIAAVVKFDQEQTAKILKKEEDKLTLLGSLGLT